ncbi:MAG: hypothetical protein JSV82_00605 [Planctomycetota bacterium]|nr:MAG: hypothetical protein JSV82_00605 [Planctomycetota bacterium]
MFRKLLIISTIVAIGFFCLSGCNKKEAESDQKVKTMAQYEAEAREQINRENINEELDQIEKSLEQELTQEQ